MRSSAAKRGAAAGLLGLLAALCVLAAPASAAVSVAFSPASLTVAPGATFDLTVEVTASGSAFNAFDARVGFAPAALTAVTMSPLSGQVGALFSGSCSNLFHRFSAGASEDTVALSMLCNGVSTTGPGTIYRLRFQASNTPQQTYLQFDQIRFYQAGLFVLPVTTQRAALGIGMDPPTLGADPAAPPTLGLREGPSPIRGRATFWLDLPRASSVSLDVFDVNGRRVRTVFDGPRESGSSAVEWDARDDEGVRVPPGAYFAVLRADGASATRRIAVLQ